MSLKRGILGSLSGRLLLGALFWTAVATSMGGYLFSIAFQEHVVDQTDQELTRIIDTMMGVTEIAVDGQIGFTRSVFDPRFERAYSGWYWQIQESESSMLRSRSLWDETLSSDLSVDQFEPVIREAIGPGGQNIRLMEMDVILPESEKRYRFSAATETKQMIESMQSFDQMLVTSLGFITLAIVVGVVVQLWFGLRPIREIGENLEDVRSGKSHHLKGDWPREIDPLAEEINALIHHNEQIVERARTHVGNLAHALKTPLSVIVNESESSKIGSHGKTIARQASEMKSHIDHHLKRARVAAGGRGNAIDVDEAVHAIIRTMKRIHSDKAIVFRTNLEDGLKFEGIREDLVDLLGNVVDNACKWAKSEVAVSVKAAEAGPRGPFLQIIIEDDGKGVSAAELPQLFERGQRFDEHVPGTGLGLAIVRDVSEMYGGKVEAVVSTKLGGLKIILTLPAKLFET